jgi:hypothetical protein
LLAHDGDQKDARLITEASPSKQMIRFLLLQNRQGKTRLSKWWVPYEDNEKHQIAIEASRLLFCLLPSDCRSLMRVFMPCHSLVNVCARSIAL